MLSLNALIFTQWISQRRIFMMMNNENLLNLVTFSFDIYDIQANELWGSYEWLRGPFSFLYWAPDSSLQMSIGLLPLGILKDIKILLIHTKLILFLSKCIPSLLVSLWWLKVASYTNYRVLSSTITPAILRGGHIKSITQLSSDGFNM